MLIACKDSEAIKDLKSLLSIEFEMDLGNAKKTLGMEIYRERKEDFLYLS